MLVLTRKIQEAIRIGKIKVTVVQMGHNSVRLGIEAPDEVLILRDEIPEKSETTIETDVVSLQ